MQQLTARLTRDAQVRTLKDGRKVVNFDVAKNWYYRTKEGEPVRHTDFYQCSYWLSTAVAPFLKKGMDVELFGRISTNAYLGKDGKPKASLQMHASYIDIRSRKKQDAEEGATPPQSDTMSSPDNDDLPF